MKVNVRLFAIARESAGTATLEVELSEDATVAQLREALVRQVPGLSGLTGQLRFAVNEDYVAEDRVIAMGDDVACIPPVSGG